MWQLMPLAPSPDSPLPFPPSVLSCRAGPSPHTHTCEHLGLCVQASSIPSLHLLKHTLKGLRAWCITLAAWPIPHDHGPKERPSPALKADTGNLGYWAGFPGIWIMVSKRRDMSSRSMRPSPSSLCSWERMQVEEAQSRSLKAGWQTLAHGSNLAQSPFL